jgi:DNA-binding NtrC family response regulator
MKTCTPLIAGIITSALLGSALAGAEELDPRIAALQKNAAEFVTASNGAEAVEIIRTDPSIDAVLTDIRMPKMDGLELARRVREIRYGMPFLLTTGYHGTEDTGELSALGIAELLTKPVNTERLAKAVRGVLDVSQPAQSESPVVPNASQPRSG